MGKTKIMIVENEDVIAMNMNSVLSNMGYEICELVKSGEDAIKNAEKERPDVVLMDIMLDGKINGIIAAIEIHYRYGIPIIFVTGCIEEGTRELATEAEPIEYLVKPVKLEDLRLAIEKAISIQEKS